MTPASLVAPTKMLSYRGHARSWFCAPALAAAWLYAPPALAAAGEDHVGHLVVQAVTGEGLPGDADCEWISRDDVWSSEDDWSSEPHAPAPWHEPVLDDWCLQWLPPNVIYHSYMAGVHEPRMALVTFYDGESHAYWDATLGGRAPLVRYGNRDPLRPQGFQLDFYGAAIARLDAEQRQDLEACDYVFGFPLTYGVESWQFKFGYAHVSSHLGDERAIRDPAALAKRVNYVRDGVVFGSSYYAHTWWRLYWETGWAFHRSGGARPLDTQFGTELAPLHPTGSGGAPFFAINGRLRQDVDFGGDMAVQLGWLRRGDLGQTWRLGLHYYNGKSSQFQFYNTSEQQLGLGMWYDF